MTPDEKLQESIVVMRAASDREQALRRAEVAEAQVATLEVSLDICRATLARLYERYYDTFTADEVEQIAIAMEWSEVSE